MAQDNIPKSVKDRVKEWGKKTNMSNNPPKNTQPAPEQTKVPEETHKTQSNLTVQEKMEKFFKDHNIDTKEAFIPEFSRYIELSGSSREAS